MSEYRYYIKKIYQPSSDQVILEAGYKNGRPVFDFRPGQYAMISYRNAKGQIEDKHAFSIASSPDKTDSIIFGIKIQGSFTKGLLDLKVGDELSVFGPYGNFCYDENKYSDSVMLAGGIGITPFFSALSYASNLRLNNKLSLIYSARTKSNATFYNEIKNLKENNSNISALFSFTDEANNSLDNDIINKRIDAKIIKDFVGNIEGKTFFICGPSLFMAAMVANLLSLGASRNQIKMEEFSMIPDSAFLSRLRNCSYALVFSVFIFIIFFSLVYKPSKSSIKNNSNSDLNSVPKTTQIISPDAVPASKALRPKIIPSNVQIKNPTPNSVPTVNTVTNQPAVSIPVSAPAPTITTPQPQDPTPVYIPTQAPAPAPVTGSSPAR